MLIKMHVGWHEEQKEIRSVIDIYFKSEWKHVSFLPHFLFNTIVDFFIISVSSP
jgi:hypothetical protein